MTTPHEPKPERRTWVGRWVRDELWWRDVASQAIAGSIVLLIGAVAAGILGLVPVAMVLRIVGLLAVVIVMPILTIRFAFVMAETGVRFTKWSKRGGRARAAFGWIVTIVVSFAFAGLLTVIAYSLLWLIATGAK